MSDRNEIVKLQMTPRCVTELNCALAGRMEQIGHHAFDYEALDLGFELPAHWPANKDNPATLAQLTVLAYKLEMEIRITNISLVPQEQVQKEHSQQEHERRVGANRE